VIRFRGFRTRLAVSFLGLLGAIQVAVLVAAHLATMANARARGTVPPETVHAGAVRHAAARRARRRARMATEPWARAPR
jgi:hypothetical protein